MKKAVVAIVGAVSLAVVVFGTSLYSYLRTGAHMAQEAVEDQIPAEVQIRRAQDMIEHDLTPEINRIKEQIVKKRIDVEEAQNKLDTTARALAEDRSALLTRTEQLNSEKNTFLIKDVSYSREQLKEDLETRFDYFTKAEGKFEAQKRTAKALKDGLAAAEKKLSALMDARERMELEIAQIKAQMEAVAAEEAVQQIEVDDSKFAEVQGLLKELKKDIKVREEIVGESKVDSALIPVENDSDKPSDIVDRVSAHLGVEKDAGTVAESDK